MKLENQVVNLELSQQLKEAGYPQEGLWWWWDVVDNKVWKDKPKPLLSSDPKNCYSTKEWENKHIQENYKFVAPTVAELGEILFKSKIRSNRTYISSFPEYCSKTNQFELHSTHYYNVKKDIIGNFKIDIVADTEANARAKLWLYLKKEGKL